MTDPSLVVQAILVYTVLAAGVLATVLTGFAQLRLFARAWKLGPNAALVRRGFLAASVGMGSVGGSIVALELGGPGAIGWMWIASILGMALIYADVLLAVRYRRQDDEQRRRAATVFTFADGIQRFGKPLAYVYGLAFLLFALAAGAMLQTQQSSMLLQTVGGDHWLVVGFLVLAAALGMAVPKLRSFVAALGPVAVMLYAVAMLWVLARAPGSVGAAFGTIVSGMTTGAGSTLAGGATGMLVALQVGFLRATMATEAGLGSAGFTPEADATKDPEQAASAAMLAPLISGIVVPTLTALVVLCSTPWTGQRLDEPAERLPTPDLRIASEVEQVELAAAFTDGDVSRLSEADTQRVAALWAPLERPMSRGTAASLQAGQTVVLPIDALAPEGVTTDTDALLENHVYPMVMRASPRGVKVRLEQDTNHIMLALSEETEVVRELVFRDRDPQRGTQAAYDTRIAVKNEVIGPPGQQLVRLEPVDPEIDLNRLAKTKDGPYAVFGDFHFQGRIVQMFQNRWGVHHAVIEAEPDARRPLSLRNTIVSSSFRGPYLDSGEPRPPLAMVAREGFDAPIGARLLMQMRAPERGMQIGHVLASGELQVPAWRFLAETKWVILRHKTDPTQDMKIPVSSKFADGHLRFVSERRDIADFAKAHRWAAYTGPYLLPPPYEFEVEVHSGVRFPESSAYLDRFGMDRSAWVGPFAERKTLVAVHPHLEPQGNPRELYDPHPAEVAPFMDGPWVSGSGIERLGWASRLSIERGADLLLAISVLILALTTMIAWSDYGARAADFMLGRGAGLGFRLMFLAAALFGAGLTVTQILTAADTIMLGLVLLNAVGVGVVLLRSRAPKA
ncbi:MAG TPA: alanine:cation symporter family protein [Enhygromyxa sp.]|nr:alanine:cation symporter family protein [Enhygromyxa sp.]